MKIEIFNELNKLDLILEFVTTLSNAGRENIGNVLAKTILHNDDFVLLATENNNICGVFAFFVERQNNYLEMTHAFSDNIKAYDALFTYLTNNFKNYELDVVIKTPNAPLTKILKRLDAEFGPVQIKMSLVKFAEYNHNLKIVAYNAKYRNDYLQLHSTDVYWTGERVLENLNIFKVFLAVCDSHVVGYIDATYTSAENEPYDLFVKEEYRNKGYGKALVSETVKAILPNNVFVWIDTDNLSAVNVFQSLGFVQTPEQMQTVTLKL